MRLEKKKPIKSEVNDEETVPTKTKFVVPTGSDVKWLYCQKKNCEFWTQKPQRMERHLKSHIEGSKHFQCPDCGEKFNSLPRFLRHDRRMHTREQDYECKICEAEVTDIHSHMKVSICKNTKLVQRLSI